MQKSEHALAGALALSMSLSLGVLSLVGAGAHAEAETSGAGASLELVVHGTGGGGIVNWALYADEAQHESGEQLRGGRQDADGESTVVAIGPVEPGRYSVAVFLDEDDDGDFDTNFLGIPREPFGFSNDASGMLGKPSFEDAAFEVGSDRVRIEMTLTDL